MISELTFHVLDKMLLITHNRILHILLCKLSPFGIFGKFIWVRILSNKLYRIGSLSTMILSFIQCLNKIKFFFQKSNWSRVTLTFCVNFVGSFCHEITEGQKNSKWFLQANVSSKKWTNKFDVTTCQLVFVRFLEEGEDTKKTFRN